MSETHHHNHGHEHAHGHSHEHDHGPEHAHGRAHGHDHGPEHGDGGGHGHSHEHPAGIKGFLHGLFVPHSHDAADSIDDALEASAEGVRAVKMSLLILLGTTILQFIVVLFSGSIALLADTVHNFSDALTAIPLWIAFVLARRTATTATPTVSAVPRTSPGCSSWPSSHCPPSSPAGSRSTG